MKDGRIARYHFYEDTFAIAAASGTPEPGTSKTPGSRRSVP